MEAVKTIAVTGKGGTGKTMLSTLMVKLLAEKYPGRVLAIDADSAMSLPYTLGIEVENTVSDMREELIGSKQAKTALTDGEDPMAAVMRRILAHGDGFDLLAMGRPEEPGCFCAVNDLLRFGIDSLAKEYDVVVIDGEAGPEQLNRRVMRSLDTLLVVSDMSARSLRTAGGIIEVASSGGSRSIRVGKAGLVLNRVRGDEPEEELVKKTGLEVMGAVPEDNILNEYDRQGRSLMDLPADSASVTAVNKLLVALGHT